MLKFTHPTLIVISGLTWLLVGLYLLPLGINFLVESSQANPFNVFLPLIQFLDTFTSRENAVVILAALGLYIGYMKGKLILAKTVQKGVERVASQPNPAPVTCIFTPKYLVLLAVMMGLGMSLKIFNFPIDIRGLVDVAIGAALINGAMNYFRQARNLRPAT